MFVAGWRHALRSEWPFIIIIIIKDYLSPIFFPELIYYSFKGIYPLKKNTAEPVPRIYRRSTAMNDGRFGAVASLQIMWSIEKR